MDYEDVFGKEVGVRKKKVRILALAEILIDLKRQGASTKQLQQYLLKREGLWVSENYLKRLIIKATKDRMGLATVS